MRRSKVTLMVLTLNEEEGMKAVMPRVDSRWVDQVLVVDGGSADGTVEVARRFGYEVYIQQERGLRQAYAEAWPLIRGDIVITFSPDGNCIPEDIPRLVAKMEEGGYDMVIASRYAKGAHSEDDDVVTAFGNWLFTTVINVLHGSRYTDAMTIYRAYRPSLFYALDLDKEETYAPYERLFGTRIGVEPILSVRAAKARLKVGEIPSDEPKRIGGVRKLQVVRWGLAYMAQVLAELFIWRKRRESR